MGVEYLPRLGISVWERRRLGVDRRKEQQESKVGEFGFCALIILGPVQEKGEGK